VRLSGSIFILSDLFLKCKLELELELTTNTGLKSGLRAFQAGMPIEQQGARNERDAALSVRQ
jgi:hypothetical protein